jgi:hypothetical protein
MAGRKSDLQVAQRWQEWITAQAQSPLGVREFCSQHELKPATFYGWRRRLNPPEVPAATFVPIRVVAAPAIEIVLPAGLVVRLPGGTDPAHLARLVAELGATTC